MEMRGVLVTMFPVFAALLACGYDSDDTRSGSATGGAGGYGGSSSNDAASSTIDTGAPLTTEPGQGIGILIDYEGGGRWHVHVACDTALSNEQCFWDVIVEPLDGATLRNVSTEGLESTDAYDWDAGAARLTALTGTDNDGFFIDADPGAPLLVDVWLDEQPGNEFMYWISDGAMNRGSPKNPLILTPSAP
jgi:hypothetical protein